MSHHRPRTDGRGDADRSEDPTGTRVAELRDHVPAGEPRDKTPGAARRSGRAAPETGATIARLLHVRAL